MANGEVREMPGVLIANAAVETAVFNAALLSSAVEDPIDLDRRITIALVYFGAKGLDWSFWLCEDHLDRKLRRQLEHLGGERGLRLATRCPGMLAARLSEARRDFPELTYRAVGDAETRLDFCQITSVCFGIPFSTSAAIYNSPKTWETGFSAHIAYRRGRAVATAATSAAAGAVGLYSIATLPDHQGRGIGEAVTRHAVECARPQDRPLVLQATAQGGALYRRLGFREVTGFAVLVRE